MDYGKNPRNNVLLYRNEDDEIMQHSRQYIAWYQTVTVPDMHVSQPRYLVDPRTQWGQPPESQQQRRQRYRQQQPPQHYQQQQPNTTNNNKNHPNTTNNPPNNHPNNTTN